MLSKFGYRDVESAWNGVEMVQLVKAGPRYDLVLCDLMMPHMDGMEALAELQRHFGEEDASADLGTMPTIVAVTANAQPETEEDCRARGMNGYLTKPLTMRKLQREIIRLFDGAQS